MIGENGEGRGDAESLGEANLGDVVDVVQAAEILDEGVGGVQGDDVLDEE